MFNLAFYCLFVPILLTPLGCLLKKNSNINFIILSSQLIYGIILISFISLIINFFSPLNIMINTLIMVLPLLIFFKKLKYFFSVIFLKFLFFNAIIIFLLTAYSKVYTPDAALYHLPYIDILNNEKIVIGLSNLHFRFGHISIIQYFSASLNNIIFQNNGIIISLAVVGSAVIINFLSHIFNYFKNQKYNFHFFYLFSIIIFIAYKMNRYSEYGNDAPTHFLFFFLLSEIILSLNNKNKYDISNNFILSIFILLNKITMAFALVLPFVFLKKKEIINTIKIKKFYFGFFFLFFWIIKNILISGCLVYPMAKLCITNLEWTDIEQVNYVAAENEAWTKDYPNYKNTNNISHLEYTKNFNWLSTWSKVHLKKILEILLPYIAFILLIYSYLYLNQKNKRKIFINKINYKYLLLILLMLGFTFIWFLKVPMYRYGYSYFISLISLIFAFFCIKLNLDLKKSNQFFKFFIMFCLIIFITKNSYRIIKYNNLFSNNNVIPKIILNKKSNFEKVNLEEFFYYESVKECGYGYSPCTHYRNLNLKAKKLYNYKIISKN